MNASVRPVRRAALEALEGRRLMAASYTVTPLTPGVGPAFAHGMSPNGNAALTVNGNAAVYLKGKLIDLGFKGTAYDVNDSGVVVGIDETQYEDYYTDPRPFVWQNGVLTHLTLGDPAVDEWAYRAGGARAINNAGVIVGSFFTREPDNDLADQIGFTAVVGQPPKAFTPPGEYTKAALTDVNEKGQILGYAHDGHEGNYPTHAFIRTNGVTTMLPELPGGDRSTAAALNEKGVIALAGTVKPTPNLYSPTVDHFYTVNSNGFGPAVDKAFPAEAEQASPSDINDGNVVALSAYGIGEGGNGDAYLYDGAYKRLDNLIDPALGLNVLSAAAIGNDGRVLVTAERIVGGDTRTGVFVLTPVKQATYAIRGTAFNDGNKNGKLDKGETGSGVRTVFLDADNDGTLDAGEINTRTKPDGTYAFPNLPAGTYDVARVLPNGFYLTSSSGNGLTRAATVGKADVSGVDLGSNTGKPTPPPTNAAARITGTVFNDANKNGKQDNGETNSGVRTVFLDLDGDNRLDANEKSVQSDARGVFAFTGLAAGTYRVTRVFPAGYKLSNTAAGYLTVTVAAGQTVTGVNLGSRTA